MPLHSSNSSDSITIRRLQGDWVAWWHQCSPSRRKFPAICVILFWGLHFFLGGFRGDHLALGFAILAAAYAGPITAPWFRLFLPMALMGVVFDGQGYLREALHGQLTIHVTEPATFDRIVFGITSGESTLTPAEWMQQHTFPFLDLVCGITYIGFIPFFILIAIWYRGIPAVKSTPENRRRIHEVESMTWAFFWLGLVSCLTYYLYPAAPPWYLEQYGPGPVVLDAPPSAAGAARTDALLRTTLFAEFYARSPNVFGAIPSLHVAIPLLTFCFACRLKRLRVVTGAYTFLMGFSAIYLNHHYVLDLLWGAVYAIAIARMVAGPIPPANQP